MDSTSQFVAFSISSLSSQLLLVVLNGAWPWMDALVFTHPYLFGNLIRKFNAIILYSWLNSYAHSLAKNLRLNASCILPWSWILHTNMLYDHAYYYDIVDRISHSLTWLISLKSWLTSIMPPSNALMAYARASIVSMSRWLVGSSSSRRCGLQKASQANTTLQRWPSERFLIGQIYNKWNQVDHYIIRY